MIGSNIQKLEDQKYRHPVNETPPPPHTHTHTRTDLNVYIFSRVKTHFEVLMPSSGEASWQNLTVQSSFFIYVWYN
jgi:hypothetical protein